MIQIDSKLIRDKFAGTFLVKSCEEAALIEVSTAHAVDIILKALLKDEITPESVKYVFVTHIHLDHAGGAGALLKKLPNAKLVVHPSGSRHMVDPNKLIQGANTVYGEEVVKRDYGNIEPVPKDKIIECSDGEVFTVGKRELTTIYTPGHARHHISIFDRETKGIFTGDSFGLSYPEMTVNNRRFYQPTTTPTAFEYDKMILSIEKMMSYCPKKIYFTHYGDSSEPDEVKSQVVKRLKDYIDMTLKLKDSKNIISDLKESLSSYYIEEAHNHGTKLTDNEILELFNIDINLNSMGLALWLERISSL